MEIIAVYSETQRRTINKNKSHSLPVKAVATYSFHLGAKDVSNHLLRFFLNQWSVKIKVSSPPHFVTLFSLIRR
jgi:hypothetical protein